MINVIERARKSAGISSFERDVPPKRERGARYWAKFVLAVRVHTENLGEQLLERTKKVSEQAAQISRLQAELFAKDKMLIRHGIKEVTRNVPGLTVEHRRELLETVDSGNSSR